MPRKRGSATAVLSNFPGHSGHRTGNQNTYLAEEGVDYGKTDIV